MKYVALLRGINVGGNTIIKMTDLKASFEKLGFTNVITFIQSGNVIFETDEKRSDKIRSIIEDNLIKAFSLTIRVILLTYDQFKEVVADVPGEWKTKNDLRCYIAFVRGPVMADDVLKEVKVKEEVDSVKSGKGAVYMSTKLSGLTKSGFTKLSSKTIYKDITIRNYNTAKKILALMES